MGPDQMMPVPASLGFLGIIKPIWIHVRVDKLETRFKKIFNEIKNSDIDEEDTKCFVKNVEQN